MTKLEVLQNFILKRSMGLLENTKTASVRVVFGIESLAVRFAFLKLKHLRRILLKPETSLVRVVLEQIRLQKADRPRFLSECMELCAALT